MRKLLFIAALALALPIMAQAQEAPRAEIFGGYSYIRLSDDFQGTLGDQDLNGWNTSANITLFKPWLGIKADFSGHMGDIKAPGQLAGLGFNDTRMNFFLAGPQITLRKNERFQPFVHALFGAVRLDADNDTTGIDFDDTTFGMAIGGGLDVKVFQNRVALRLFQADYVLTRFKDPLTQNRENQNNFRTSTGLVLRLGSVE